MIDIKYILLTVGFVMLISIAQLIPVFLSRDKENSLIHKTIAKAYLRHFVRQVALCTIIFLLVIIIFQIILSYKNLNMFFNLNRWEIFFYRAGIVMLIGFITFILNLLLEHLFIMVFNIKNNSINAFDLVFFKTGFIKNSLATRIIFCRFICGVCLSFFATIIVCYFISMKINYYESAYYLGSIGIVFSPSVNKTLSTNEKILLTNDHFTKEKFFSFNKSYMVLFDGFFLGKLIAVKLLIKLVKEFLVKYLS